MAEQIGSPDDPDDVTGPDDPAGDIELFPASRIARTLYRLAAATPPVLAMIVIASSDSISNK